MNETTEACVRGCGMYRRHLDECDGYTPSGKPCRGCLPRRAEYGHLCWPCHRRLELMLHDAETVDRWMTGNLTGNLEPQEHEERRTKRDSPPAPLQTQVLDQRDLIRDQLSSWVDLLCSDVGLTGPKSHDAETDAAYLRTWLSTVERQSWVADLWNELADGYAQAHALTPWRPPLRRIKGVACPNKDCQEVNLVIYGGETDVTCQSCKTMILEAHFGLWEQIFREEQAKAAG